MIMIMIIITIIITTIIIIILVIIYYYEDRTQGTLKTIYIGTKRNSTTNAAASQNGPTQICDDTFNVSYSTRKPCYRKDDRAMRPIYGCPQKFRESSPTPPATFPEICKGHLFRSILRRCIQNLKFVALSVPEKIGATQKIWAVPRYVHAPPFSLQFVKGFCSDGPCEYTCQI